MSITDNFDHIEIQGAYKHHFLSEIFGSGAYRSPMDFFPKIAYIGVIFKVAKI